MSVPFPHERILPNMAITEQGLAELEIWLRRQFGQGGNGWRFNVLNGVLTAPSSERGYGYVQFTACVDLDETPDPLAAGGSWGGAFEDDSGCGLILGSTTEVFIKGRQAPVGLLADGETVNITARDPNGNINITSDGDLAVSSDNIDLDSNTNITAEADQNVTINALGNNLSLIGEVGATMESNTGNLTLTAPATEIDLRSTGVTVTLGTGIKLNVKDHNGNLIYTLDEATGDIHMKTGSTITADL